MQKMRNIRWGIIQMLTHLEKLIYRTWIFWHGRGAGRWKYIKRSWYIWKNFQIIARTGTWNVILKEQEFKFWQFRFQCLLYTVRVNTKGKRVLIMVTLEIDPSNAGVTSRLEMKKNRSNQLKWQSKYPIKYNSCNNQTSANERWLISWHLNQGFIRIELIERETIQYCRKLLRKKKQQAIEAWTQNSLL